ncbi:MAG: O-methyltransferase [Lutibacter sp.]
MSFYTDKIEDYIVNHSQQEPELLHELNKETWQKVLNPRMLSGAYQGRLLALLSKLQQPKKILEIGTYTGYSALCLAEGLSVKGQLFTIDVNEELKSFASKYFKQSKFKNNIIPLTGSALEIIPTLNHQFDLVFIDADKENYSNYFDLIIDKMNKGGLIISDNVLWSGKVVEPIKQNDKNTLALIAFNKKLSEDKRIETVMLPVRDGLTLSRIL